MLRFIFPLHLLDLKVMKFDNVVQSGQKELRIRWSSGKVDEENTWKNEKCLKKCIKNKENVVHPKILYIFDMIFIPGSFYYF